MDPTTLKMAMAGFFHDIGKFADRDTLGVTEQYINDNAGIYLPSWDGRYSHHHAVYTAAFIEQMKDFLPPELNMREWGDGDSFINLAAGHHKPETPMQQIITVSDWLTSEMDRDLFDEEKSTKIAFKDYKKTRLLPLFEQLKRTGMDSMDEFNYAYPLLPISPLNIFPEKRRNKGEQEDAKEEYRELFDQFKDDLRGLLHAHEDIGLWFEHFESLFMVYASSIPAARVGSVVPDVSLYDHCRLTSAFAAALYRYHKDTGSLDADAIKDKGTKKFILITGNFFGIQNFIFTGYGDSRKYRSKILRGRSFYVMLLSEMAGDMLAREIGLPSISIILNAAGRFTLLAPNTESTMLALEKTKQQINDWLVEISCGEISIGFSHVYASYDDFTPENFIELWEEMGRSEEEVKFQKIDLHRYGGRVAGYLDRFNNELPHPLCPLCGKRPAEEGTEQALPSDDIGPVCGICRDHVLIGSELVRDERKRIYVTHGDSINNNGRGILSKLLFNQYQLFFSSVDGMERLKGAEIIKCWDISMSGTGHATGGVTKKSVSNYVPVYTEDDMKNDAVLETEKSESKKLEMIEEILPGAIKSFHYIAAAALNRKNDGTVSGIDALGILKADVDDLGMLMGCGLPESRFTITRLAVLSRQLNYYFVVYIPYLLASDKRFRDVYTVFSGGDDLFLIGPWNKIYKLVLELRRSFADYVCHNPEIHFSAGITLQKPGTPLNTFAESTEFALEKAKVGNKDRLTMFFETVEWKDMDTLEEIRNKLEAWLRDELITKSMLYRLNRFIEMATMEKQVLNKRQVAIDAMQCLKWRAMFSYSAARNLAKKEKDENRRKQIVEQMMGELVNWLETYRGGLRIPLWNVLYNHR